MARYRTSKFKRMKRRYARKLRSVGTKGLKTKRISNKYVFKRAGQEQTIMNTGPGTVALTNTGITGWALAGTTADANNLYQFGGAFQAQLNQVEQWGDFAQLFDRYKISGVKLKFIPLTNSSEVGNAVPMIAYAIDLDDASVPSSYAELNQKYNVHKKRLDKPCSIYIKPRVASSIYSGLTSGYAVGKPMYIDCNDPGVPHYGLKYWIRDMSLGSTTTNTVVRIETTYYLSLKDPQ